MNPPELLSRVALVLAPPNVVSVCDRLFTGPFARNVTFRPMDRHVTPVTARISSKFRWWNAASREWRTGVVTRGEGKLDAGGISERTN